MVAIEEDLSDEECVCANCIGDSFVKEHIVKQDNVSACTYCQSEGPCISMDDLSDWTDKVYRENYQPGDEQPFFSYDDDSMHWRSAGESPEDIISEMLECDLPISEALVAMLSSVESMAVGKDCAVPYYESTDYYEFTPTQYNEHSSVWQEFCETVKHCSRFFNKDAIDMLDHLFEGLKNLSCSTSTCGSPIYMIGKDDEVFLQRARRAITKDDRIRACVTPAYYLASPPSDIAPASRMNPAGIPVFYGAFDRDTCLSELRMTVGEMAVSGTFKVMKPLQALDLTVFHEIHDSLSFYDPEFRTKVSKIEFLSRFEDEINKPILTHEEALEYIPSQALFEYFSSHQLPFQLFNWKVE